MPLLTWGCGNLDRLQARRGIPSVIGSFLLSGHDVAGHFAQRPIRKEKGETAYFHMPPLVVKAIEVVPAVVAKGVDEER